MQSLIFNSYLLIKSLHVISIIAWMAGLLYLPRLFVYHTKFIIKSESYETFLIMEYKLLRYIMTPSMILSFVFGMLLIYAQDNGVWLHIKLLCVFLLCATHGMMIKYYKAFKAYNNVKSERFFRIFNEMPTILMIIIVIMAIMKPYS